MRVCSYWVYRYSLGHLLKNRCYMPSVWGDEVVTTYAKLVDSYYTFDPRYVSARASTWLRCIMTRCCIPIVAPALETWHVRIYHWEMGSIRWHDTSSTPDVYCHWWPSCSLCSRHRRADDHVLCLWHDIYQLSWCTAGAKLYIWLQVISYAYTRFIVVRLDMLCIPQAVNVQSTPLTWFKPHVTLLLRPAVGTQCMYIVC